MYRTAIPLSFVAVSVVSIGLVCVLHEATAEPEPSEPTLGEHALASLADDGVDWAYVENYGREGREPRVVACRTSGGHWVLDGEACVEALPEDATVLTEDGEEVPLADAPREFAYGLDAWPREMPCERLSEDEAEERAELPVALDLDDFPTLATGAAKPILERVEAREDIEQEVREVVVHDLDRDGTDDELVRVSISLKEATTPAEEELERISMWTVLWGDRRHGEVLDPLLVLVFAPYGSEILEETGAFRGVRPREPHDPWLDLLLYMGDELVCVDIDGDGHAELRQEHFADGGQYVHLVGLDDEGRFRPLGPSWFWGP